MHHTIIISGNFPCQHFVKENLSSFPAIGYLISLYNYYWSSHKKLRLYKIATTLYKVFHNLVTMLSPHCDKIVFETCNNLVTILLQQSCYKLVKPLFITLSFLYGMCTQTADLIHICIQNNIILSYIINIQPWYMIGFIT